MAAKYPPFVNAYGKISDLFDAIKKASVPPKFTYDFLESVLGLKSSSYRAMIPLLKKLDFLDQASAPTDYYKNYRDDSQSGTILAGRVKEAYSDLYKAAEYAHKLSKEELTTKLKTLLGVGNDDNNIGAVVGTFQELVKLSNFDSKKVVKHSATPEKSSESEIPIAHKKEALDESLISLKTKFGISYTINLNLPATTEIEVYNSIFKALKDNLINE